MSKKHDPSVIALRMLRKSSHLSKRLASKAAFGFSRIEQKAGKIIVNKTGSIDGDQPVSAEEFFYRRFPYLFPIHPALPNLHQKPSVTVFVPSLSSKGFYGGIATLLIVSARLAEKLEYDYRIVQTNGFEKSTAVLEFLRSKGISIKEDQLHTIDASRRTIDSFAYLPLHPDDVVVVSAWWDAHVAAQLPLKKKFIYMIQDYEPIFYNNGDEREFAEQTYHSDAFIPLCNTELMYKHFLQDNRYQNINKNAVWFEPAVAVKKKPKNKSSTMKTLFLYGRPHVDRNMFYTAIRAIELALQDPSMADYEWSIYSAGESSIPDIRLSSGQTIKNLGKLSMDDYYSFASGVDIAVSPMLAPHPNYPTLELASVGATVITTRYDVKTNLENYSTNIILCEPTVDSMAKKIIHATRNKPASDKTHIGSDWIGALEKPLNDVMRKL